jgi:hypothetical protein
MPVPPGEIFDESLICSLGILEICAGDDCGVDRSPRHALPEALGEASPLVGLSSDAADGAEELYARISYLTCAQILIPQPSPSGWIREVDTL